MKKVYIVCWGSAAVDEDGDVNAHSGIHGVYTSLESAKVGLEECKDESYDELVYDPNCDEEEQEFNKVNTSIYGSVDEEYFEIDSSFANATVEIRMSIEEVEIKD